MGAAAINDVGRRYPLGDGPDAALGLGGHAAGHDAGFDQLAGTGQGHLADQGAWIVPVPQDAGGVGEQDQLFGLEGCGQFARHRVGIDVVGLAHNLNADTVAGELAAALQADKLSLLTDTPGILRDRDDPSSLIRQVSLAGARALIEDGIVAGGMTPKTECCIRAIAQGVAAAHIVDGRSPHALLLEVFTDAGIGTMVVGSQRQISG